MKERPILVTGAHRSATTWVGKVLAQAGPLLYLPEPFSPNNTWLPTTIREKPFKTWFLYITQENEAGYREFMDATLGYGCPLAKELRAIKRPKDLGRVLWRRRLVHGVGSGRLTPLMRDPVALFSAEWLTDVYDMRVVVMVRHPAAFVESVIRQNWTFDFQNLACQDALLSELLPAYRDRVEAFAQTPPNLLDTAILQWLLAYEAVRQYQERHPEWIYVRHEDLSRDPVTGFDALLKSLNLPFTSKVKALVESSSNTANPVDTKNPLSIMRDSRKIAKKWKNRLPEEDISHIRKNVEGLSRHFYTDEDW